LGEREICCALICAVFRVSGHYVPQLSQLVYRRNIGVDKPVINFKGFMVKTEFTQIKDFISSQPDEPNESTNNTWKYNMHI
jgi:hypothetical protein